MGLGEITKQASKKLAERNDERMTGMKDTTGKEKNPGVC